MKILNENSDIPINTSLILGFFDGIHIGHQEVLKNTLSKNKVIVTFSDSPAKYFNRDFYYIYSREYNYELLEKQGINYIYEQDFSKIVNLTAQEYLDFLINKFRPVSITTGFNHTFGFNRLGNPEFIKNNQKNFKYFCTEPKIIDNEVVSSSIIKKYLLNGNIKKANILLGRDFSIESSVIKGEKIGRKLGFPTANLKYPAKIIKIPYGVYKVKVLNKPAVMNWGIKPTFGSKEVIEVHIPNFKEDLYGKTLRIDIIDKIRDEKKFANIEDLKNQIKEDVNRCLEL